MINQNARILVIDDMMPMRKYVVKNCKAIGFSKVFEAADGQKAWDLLESSSEPFDMIISDWNMPVMSGVELLKKIRASDKYKDIPFLLVTAEAEKKQIVEALSNGATGYVVKPFTTDTLRTQISNISKRNAA